MPRVSPRDGRAAWGRTRQKAGQAADDRRPGPDRTARSPHLLASPPGSGRRRGRHDHAAPTGPAPPRARQKAGRCVRPAGPAPWSRPIRRGSPPARGRTRPHRRPVCRRRCLATLVSRCRPPGPTYYAIIVEWAGSVNPAPFPSHGFPVLGGAVLLPLRTAWRMFLACRPWKAPAGAPEPAAGGWPCARKAPRSVWRMR